MLSIKSLICMAMIVCLLALVHSEPNAGVRSTLKERGAAQEVLDKLQCEFKSCKQMILRIFLTKDVFDKITKQERAQEIVIEDLIHTLSKDISQIDCGIYEPVIEGL